MSRLQFAAIVVVLPLLLVACASQATPTPTAPPAAAAASAVTPTTGPTTAPTSATTVAATQATPSAAASPSAAVVAESTVKVANDATLGPILTDAKGMTLYRYTKDQADTSNCYDQCATNWPPLLVTSGQPAAPTGLQGTLGLTTRKDGAKQATYNGMPLYYWAKDAKPGDTTGQGVGSVWFVTKPGEMLAAEGQPVLEVASDAKLGEILADPKGWTLYRYTKDQPDQSNCYDQCAQNWPPVVLTAGQPMALSGLSGLLGLITRKDGGMQLTYNKLPLYYWVKDAKPGDTTGQSVGTVGSS